MRQKQVREYRGQIPSPGRPTVAWREDRVRFWAAIARGVKTEDAAVEAGVSSPVAFRWFRHAGGVMPKCVHTWVGREPDTIGGAAFETASRRSGGAGPAAPTTEPEESHGFPAGPSLRTAGTPPPSAGPPPRPGCPRRAGAPPPSA